MVVSLTVNKQIFKYLICKDDGMTVHIYSCQAASNSYTKLW
jgi:hypothetical protein